MKKNKKQMQSEIKFAFEMNTVNLNVEDIIPIKPTPKDLDKSNKFGKILSSIKEVGIIEPPAVSPDASIRGKYILLDGHLRLEALKKLGIKKVDCLLSKDDEAFTYNKFINRLSAIQEHKMIVEAVKRGVPEEKIAQALNVDVTIHNIRTYILRP
jgi:ParB-like chromosome segregation protein Spo0J